MKRYLILLPLILALAACSPEAEIARSQAEQAQAEAVAAQAQVEQSRYEADAAASAALQAQAESLTAQAKSYTDAIRIQAEALETQAWIGFLTMTVTAMAVVLAVLLGAGLTTLVAQRSRQPQQLLITHVHRRELPQPARPTEIVLPDQVLDVSREELGEWIQYLQD